MESKASPQPLDRRLSQLLQFRWLLFLWLSATLTAQNQAGGGSSPLALLPPALLLLSQLLLWRVPRRLMEGLKVYYTVFLFDLMLILLNLQASGQLRQDLVITFFSGIFIAALTKRVGATFVSALLLCAAYLAYEAHLSGGLPRVEGAQLLNLPFLLISSIHSGLVAQEAEHESESKRRLVADHQALSTRFKNTFFESNRFNHDIKALLDTLPFSVVMLDRTQGVRFFNATAELVFGLSRKVVQGSLLAQIPELAGLREALERQEDVLDGGFQRLDVQQVEGYPVPLILSSYSVAPQDGAPVGTLVILTPVPYHDAMAEFVHRKPLDDRLPLGGPRTPPKLPLADWVTSLVA